ncbi:type IV toxin-antitoxin system AbiEi family antitoxin domain-containing protein [Mycolicibacter icosiumassiliensis]|uniref:type IV toxin-antitoxin system AbiEi family antitoxin domain-containing protein n=1 Tax=Mycolicibacter icosiumassiliensis TaxID=1792835 RepID=UPI00082CEA59|nr:type IV toxin-antitoxin system AbiEi family antitoxin domain-containing protein [Mycolicibacter icosiumassiliensis]
MDNYLRRHDGVITRSQALECGLSSSAIGRRIQSGRWRRCGPGVYFADDRPFTTAARIRAAVWSYGTEAVASGLAAAWWHQLTTATPNLIEVTVPRNSHGRPHRGTHVRRRDLSPKDVVERRGLLVTGLALTTLEAAARRGGGPTLMDTALQRHTELPHLWHAHLRNSGRHGSPTARRMLHAAEGGARSQAERILVRLLHDAGITGWQANYRLGGYQLDIAFPDVNVAIEVDGWAFHSSPNKFEGDRVRQNQIVLLGWTVLRFTWLDLTTAPDRVIAQVRRAISAR